MHVLGNILWFLFGGFIQGLGWLFSGLVLCVTIIGIPFGIQCFKIAGMQFFPFGKRVAEAPGGGCASVLGNVIWVVFAGWELALANLLSALVFAITIIGIPFAKQSLKLAGLSLMPFGKEIIKDY